MSESDKGVAWLMNAHLWRYNKTHTDTTVRLFKSVMRRLIVIHEKTRKDAYHPTKKVTAHEKGTYHLLNGVLRAELGQ